MSFRKVIPVVAIFTAITACSNQNTVPGAYKPVTPLSATTRAAVDQNLKNGILPSPADVANEKVAQTADACLKFKAKIPSDWIQDLIEVPEDPSNPDGQKINVFYYGKLKENTTPVVFFNGGPGSNSHSSFSNFTNNQYILDPNKDVSMIYIDQRGNGCSDFYPQVKDQKNPDQETLERLSLYGSKGIVSDAEAIRKKLIGDKPWIAFGQSYGAFIVHRYIETAPQSLKSAFAHANTIDTDGYERLKNRISSQLRVMSTYFKTYPDDQAALDTLRNKLDLKTCFQDTETKQKICGYYILQLIPSKILGFNNDWPRLHQWIQIMVQNGDVRDEGIQLFLKTLYFAPNNPNNNKNWAMSVIDWSDRNVPPLGPYYCTKIKNDLEKEKSINLSEAYTECMSSLQWAANSTTPPVDESLTIQGMPQDLMTVDLLSTALKSNPALQFFWYSGQKDTYVPVENYQEELAAIKDLPNVHYTNFTGTGHDGYESEPKVWLDLIQEVKR